MKRKFESFDAFEEYQRNGGELNEGDAVEIRSFILDHFKNISYEIVSIDDDDFKITKKTINKGDCRHCEGRGGQQRSLVFIECPYCNGSGKIENL